eukprot:6007865-Pyramimonas_sp.AAC.1
MSEAARGGVPSAAMALLRCPGKPGRNENAEPQKRVHCAPPSSPSLSAAESPRLIRLPRNFVASPRLVLSQDGYG